MAQTISQGLQAKIGADLSAFRRGMRQMVREARSGGRRIKRAFGRAVRAARAVAVAVTAITAAVTGIGALAVREFVQWEEALTGVAKTVDASRERIDQMGQSIRSMSEDIPVSANQLAELAEVGGRLGVATEEIERFTRVAADLGVATELGAEQAATSMARLARLTGTPIEQLRRLGSVVVDLGNQMGTTEDRIVQVAERFAGVGRSAGLSASEVVGLSGAIAELVPQARRGASALSQTISAISTAADEGGARLRAFAEVAGTSVNDFAQLVRRDMAGAFDQFVQGIQRASERGENMTAMLESLGLNNRLVKNTLLAVSQASDRVSFALERQNVAWDEGNALTEEAARFYDRLGARLTTAKNLFINTAAALGEELTPAVDAGLGVFRRFVERVRDSRDEVGRFAERVAEEVPGVVQTVVRAVGQIGDHLVSVIEFFRNHPLVGEFGLVGFIMLGPKGAAGLAAVATAINRMSEAALPTTVGGALQKKLDDLNNQAQLLQEVFQSGRPLFTLGLDSMEEARERLREVNGQIVGVMRTMQDLEGEGGDTFDQLITKSREFFAGLMGFTVGGGGGGEGGGPSPVEQITEETRKAVQVWGEMPGKVDDVKLELAEANDSTINWADAVEDVSRIISTQIASSLGQVLTGFKSLGEAARDLGRTILGSVVGALAKAVTQALMFKAALSLLGPGSSITAALSPFGKGGMIGAQRGLMLPQAAPAGFGGGIPIMAHPGEAVLSRRAVERIGGAPAVNRLNRGQSGNSGGQVVDGLERGESGGVTIQSMTVNVSSRSEARDVEKAVVEALQNARRKGKL